LIAWSNNRYQKSYEAKHEAARAYGIHPIECEMLEQVCFNEETNCLDTPPNKQIRDGKLTCQFQIKGLMRFESILI